ncbi:MAG: cytochrome c oxidase subunit 3 [Aquisalimonadaceae bacterium]
MIVTLLFLSVLMAVFLGWLLLQSFNVSPWVAQSESSAHPRHLPAVFTAPRVGLAVFLAVVTSLFALTISAYNMRMQMGTDWRSLSEPALLWVNTGILVLGSIALQWAWGAARRGNRQSLMLGMAVGGGCTIAFIVGQYLVWQQLGAAGYYLTANPANAFFYMMTALHAVHLLGGLGAWAMTMLRVSRGAEPSEVRASVELCAVYWHYLLLIWVILFGLVLST